MSSEWSVRVVEIAKVGKHPNADNLSITQIDGGYPCILRTGELQPGDLAIYIPVDSVVPETEEYAFLGGKRRIEAKRLRGIFSMGLLRPIPEELRGTVRPGDEVSEKLGIVKYEQKMNVTMRGDCEAAPKHFNFMRYTDHLPLRKYSKVLKEGEEVIITEKLHGANARFCHDGERLWVGSHGQIKKFDENNMWWKVAAAEGLETKLRDAPMKIFYGEVFGQVQDLKYGRAGLDLRIFDVFDTQTGRYVNAPDAIVLTASCALLWVPILYKGPWDPSHIEEWGNGKSTLADCIREGFVVKPIEERWEHAGRVSLKYAGETYLLRKNKSDIDD